MSFTAEFAAELHASSSTPTPRSLTPLRYPSSCEKLYDIKAVIFDVYGTLINYWKREFSEQEEKMKELLAAFGKTAKRFGMENALLTMNPGETPAKTLRDFYHGLIGLNHEKSLKKGLTFPEVKIEQVWDIIIMLLKRHGYAPEAALPGAGEEIGRCMAFFYNFHALGRGLYPGVVDALAEMKKSNLRLGIVSNAQFYTPIDLTLFIRDQGGAAYDDYLDLFDTDLIFYSYEYGVAKPNQLLFRKLYDALYELHILPSQTVFVGNDLALDIKPAAEAGMKTAFFCGDSQSAFVHDLHGTVVPDISFTAWDELAARISFYEKGSTNSVEGAGG